MWRRKRPERCIRSFVGYNARSYDQWFYEFSAAGTFIPSRALSRPEEPAAYPPPVERRCLTDHLPYNMRRVFELVIATHLSICAGMLNQKRKKRHTTLVKVSKWKNIKQDSSGILWNKKKLVFIRSCILRGFRIHIPCLGLEKLRFSCTLGCVYSSSRFWGGAFDGAATFWQIWNVVPDVMSNVSGRFSPVVVHPFACCRRNALRNLFDGGNRRFRNAIKLSN